MRLDWLSRVGKVESSEARLKVSEEEKNSNAPRSLRPLLGLLFFVL